MFWSSVELTGNQTGIKGMKWGVRFWSSVELTGNQTELAVMYVVGSFWSSVELTGNQTINVGGAWTSGFGAVSN